jgi:acyl-CoA dehydrogenase family protein 9
VRSALGASAELDVPLHERLEEHRRYFVKHVAELAAAAERAVMRHREQIVERQLVVERLADMAIEMYATAAVLSRTQRLIEERGVEGCAEELALCDLFCVEAGRRFRARREALNGREEEVDDTRREAAAAVRAHGGYWVADAILPVPDEPVTP